MAGSSVQELHKQGGLGEFTHRLAEAGRGVFMFDYDGTLAPFEVDVTAVRPYPGVTEAIDGLMGTGRARVVIVTGRFLQAAPPALATRATPEMWGSHGRERLWPDGRYEVPRIDDLSLHALIAADEWSAEAEAAGARCEKKAGALALHWRGAGPAQITRIRRLLSEFLERTAITGVLELLDFDGGIELRAPGPDKGDVVRTVLAEEPGIPAAYLGDDLSDEDAFVAIRDRGFSALVRPHFRPTAADFWLKPPGDLVSLLNDWRTPLGDPPVSGVRGPRRRRR